MYSIKFPDYNLEDFLDEMLSNKHGETYNFLKGRLLAIKNILIEKETQYISLATSDSGGLYSLNEQLSIDIPQNVLLKDILNLPRNISKKNNRVTQ
ncbi:hypothetical protein [Peribacillus sp. TH14]|uniref:hypothetical protein n=1 Tax=Peribacillus sp. TH14 TaxID=2798481 RepID=UPI00191342F0|nr:hypothetical protein [Peribacillus sp. TH14]MBK5502785.1 hypothetical protein [Peribacillus sp. TH14]